MGKKNYHFDTKRIHGADIIVYFATKGLAGHGTTIAGVVVEKGDFEFATIMIATNIINKSLAIDLDDNLIPYTKK